MFNLFQTSKLPGSIYLMNNNWWDGHCSYQPIWQGKLNGINSANMLNRQWVHVWLRHNKSVLLLQAATTLEFPAPTSLVVITSLMGSLLTALLQFLTEGKINAGSSTLSITSIAGVVSLVLCHSLHYILTHLCSSLISSYFLWHADWSSGGHRHYISDMVYHQEGSSPCCHLQPHPNGHHCCSFSHSLKTDHYPWKVLTD